MTKTAELFWKQANRFAEIADKAAANQLKYTFSPNGYHLWKDIERAARMCRVERMDRARALDAA